MKNENIFTKGKKLAYCSGIITESLLYNMFYTYYLVFLTDVVKMKPVLAGTVSFISIVWDAVTDPIVGSFADRDGADKRKFMARAAFPMGLLFVSAFTNIGVEAQLMQFIYYTCVTMLFWLAYTVYTIPYYAVVAEITQDYDERTAIRGTSSLINTLAILSGNAVPAVLPSAFMALGLSETLGWTSTAACMSVLAVLFALLAVRSLKGVRLQKAEILNGNDKKSAAQTVRDFLRVLKIKPFKWFTAFIIFFLIASSMIQSSFVYMIKYCIGEDPDKYMVVVILVLVSSMALLIPVVTRLAEKKDRRFSSLLFMSIMLTGLIFCKIIGVNSVFALIAVTVFMAAGMANFWTVFYSMAYDLVEVDEFANGTRRESIITALPQFFQKFGAAVGVYSVSIILDFCGYDGNLGVQSARVISGIENTVTLAPAFSLIISVIGVFFYPITKKRFALLKTQLENKRSGKKYDTAGLEKII